MAHSPDLFFENNSDHHNSATRPKIDHAITAQGDTPPWTAGMTAVAPGKLPLTFLNLSYSLVTGGADAYAAADRLQSG